MEKQGAAVAQPKSDEEINKSQKDPELATKAAVFK
jgi:hypothetical protein